MKKTSTKMTRYTHGKYYVDIIETREDYEAWIVGKKCGLASLMFGMPKKQQPYDEFIEIVKANLAEEIEFYEEELEDIEEMNNAKLFTV